MLLVYCVYTIATHFAVDAEASHSLLTVSESQEATGATRNG